MSPQDSSGPFHGHYTVLDDNEFQVHGRKLFIVVIIFTVLLLVTVFMLYARWVCRYRPSSSDSPSSSDAPSQKADQGLQASVIRGLPIVLYQSSGDLEASGGGECCICIGVFEDGDKIKVLPQCSHCYHSDCVDKWLTSQSSCPLCRTSLRSDSGDEPPQIVVQ